MLRPSWSRKPFSRLHCISRQFGPSCCCCQRIYRTAISSRREPILTRHLWGPGPSSTTCSRGTRNPISFQASSFDSAAVGFWLGQYPSVGQLMCQLPQGCGKRGERYYAQAVGGSLQPTIRLDRRFDPVIAAFDEEGLDALVYLYVPGA